ncbi:hypothetical protein M5689_020367 [Euphorbia peplus]|nr:hypothetical protein M5689_020367 [Euphorbia peplus]
MVFVVWDQGTFLNDMDYTLKARMLHVIFIQPRGSWMLVKLSRAWQHTSFYDLIHFSFDSKIVVRRVPKLVVTLTKFVHVYLVHYERLSSTTFDLPDTSHGFGKDDGSNIPLRDNRSNGHDLHAWVGKG